MKTNISGALLVTFVVLKLTNTIDWSWLWVLSPIWIPISLYILFFIFSLIAFAFLSKKK